MLDQHWSQTMTHCLACVSQPPLLKNGVEVGEATGTTFDSERQLFAKVSPNVTRIDEIAAACERGGADGITAINTLLGMGVDWRTGKPALNTVMGGYSGVAIKPVALRCAFEALSYSTAGVRQTCCFNCLRT